MCVYLEHLSVYLHYLLSLLKNASLPYKLDGLVVKNMYCPSISVNRYTQTVKKTNITMKTIKAFEFFFITFHAYKEIKKRINNETANKEQTKDK